MTILLCELLQALERGSVECVGDRKYVELIPAMCKNMPIVF
jgi:hypothetical protein